jgi:hypothetical protein
MEGKADQEFIWGAAMGPVHRQEKMIIGSLTTSTSIILNKCC